MRDGNAHGRRRCLRGSPAEYGCPLRRKGCRRDRTFLSAGMYPRAARRVRSGTRGTVFERPIAAAHSVRVLPRRENGGTERNGFCNGVGRIRRSASAAARREALEATCSLPPRVANGRHRGGNRDGGKKIKVSFTFFSSVFCPKNRSGGLCLAFEEDGACCRRHRPVRLERTVVRTALAISPSAVRALLVHRRGG